MRSPNLSNDDVLLATLSASLEILDPVPAAAVLAATAACESPEALGELAVLFADSTMDNRLVLFREEADYRTLTFVASRLTIEVEIEHHGKAVGLIIPPAETLIQVEAASGRSSSIARMVQSDVLGRFRIDVGLGPRRLRIGSGSDAVVTPWFCS